MCYSAPWIAALFRWVIQPEIVTHAIAQKSAIFHSLLTLMSVTVKIMGNHGSFAIFHDLTHFLLQNRLTGCI
jgi:hypothetical protein